MMKGVHKIIIQERGIKAVEVVIIRSHLTGALAVLVV